MVSSSSQIDGVDIGLEAVLQDHSDICRKTKIICTLGPATVEVSVLEEMLKTGMNVARFNFSHGDHSYHQKMLDTLRQACRNTKIMCATMLDTKGPEIRTGKLKKQPLELKAGNELTLTTDYEHLGDEKMLALSYPHLARDVHPGSQILVADGRLVLEVIETDQAKGTVRTKVVNGVSLGEKKNVNLPGVKVELPVLTDKDIDDVVNFAVKNKMDCIAASFVQSADDVKFIKKVLGKDGASVKILCKIENQGGLENYDEIINLPETDGIMVARGDLGMEIPTEKMFLAQKLMIQKCNYVGKPVITATQMLDSMVKNPTPTRAEANDVANAVLDGTDCVMLSAESAVGSYPAGTIATMARICQESEASLDYMGIFKNMVAQSSKPMSPLESLASTAVRTAHKVHARVIIVLTNSGDQARLIAKFRPAVPILAVAIPTIGQTGRIESDEGPARHCLLSRGLVPILAAGSPKQNQQDTHDEWILNAIRQATSRGMVVHGDTAVAMHTLDTGSVLKIVDIK